MDKILKKIDMRIEYWQALAAEADEMGSTATMDVCDARVDEVQRIKEIFISQQKELATDNNVVTKSGKDNNVLTIGDKMRECGEKLSKFIETITNTKDTALSPEEAQKLKAERDYWEREAKKWCAKLGEIKFLTGEQN
jgi:hypothetical protein